MTHKQKVIDLSRMREGFSSLGKKILLLFSSVASSESPIAL
ncbi:unnamed protein product [Acidithrix sp. C25]|nr:unnamed protein product [Acidithrix sp. C25]